MKKIVGIYENKHMHWVGDGSQSTTCFPMIA